MKRMVVRIIAQYGLAIGAVFILCLTHASAQSDTTYMIPDPSARPDLYAILQDSGAVYLVDVAGSGDTIDANYVTPSYMFSMQYDSVMNIHYLLTEWRHNRSILYLPSWIDKRAVNARASLLSYNSTTDTFTCVTGDTLSFYRELWWADPMTSLQDTTNYYAVDSLDYAVELVRASDSTRVALIDSVGILPNYTPGRPRIHAARPLYALVQYTVPAALDGEQAFMRILLYHRGAGKYWFTRSDSYTMAVSKRLQSSSFQYYVQLFGGGDPLYKPQALSTLDNPAPTTPYLNVAMSRTQPSRATITFASAINGGATTIGVYDASGRAIFYPFSTPASSGTQSVEYDFPQNGAYFIGLLHNGRIVVTRKVSVSR